MWGWIFAIIAALAALVAMVSFMLAYWNSDNRWLVATITALTVWGVALMAYAFYVGAP